MSFDRWTRERLPLAPLFFAFLSLTACSSEEGLVGPPAKTCADLRDECFADQMVCVEGAAGASCEACPSGQHATASGGCEDIGGNALTHDFTTFTVKPGEEIKGLCQSWTLNNSEELWINAVELTQDERSHHSIWTFVPSDQFDGPDGVWPCKERGYNELVGALAGGVLYAQSTQAEHEVQKFPNAAAVRIPPYSRIIGDIHLLNTTSEPVTGRAKLSLYALPEPDVKVKLVPLELTYRDVMVLPQSRTRLFASCDMQDAFMKSAGLPFDMKIYYVLPHSHEHGTRLFINRYGGPRDGENIFEVEGYNAEARGRAFDTPVDLSDATGLTFGCEYANTSSDTIRWGYNQEMCQFLAFVDSAVGASTTIYESKQVESDGAMNQFTGPCTTLAVKWDFDKAGGPDPKYRKAPPMPWSLAVPGGDSAETP